MIRISNSVFLEKSEHTFTQDGPIEGPQGGNRAQTENYQ